MTSFAYITENAASPTTGTQGTNYIVIRLISYGKTSKMEQGVERLPGHFSFGVPLEEWFQGLIIEGFVTTAAEEGYINNFEAIHTKGSDSAIYWVIKHNDVYHQFVDKNRTLQNYLKIVIDGTNIIFNAETGLFDVKIMISEIS